MKKEYEEMNRKLGKNQFLVPYYMSSHPGSTLEDAIELALYIKETGVMPRQVQDFYPTPSTLSTVMYYTELDPVTGKKIYVAKNPHEKAMQRALIQYKLPQNRELVVEALKKCKRMDLIGFEKQCLLRPEKRNVPGYYKKEDKTSKNGNKKPVKKKKIRNITKKKG